ncbi:guanine nucleotide-binding protein subunit alpha SCDLUD_000064 [Saccharomycodes ludwigii]|uniref:guanine nucleotide-binding protein subunit alpha n=1 Tax=Saccharomycodes ludwigii TaxID=36035 RepID=UPI001E84F24C|nr:hypothetical protein SCDLUD_000064 [Saccharomycodes ludwigii]KAH3902487.1 hypothetical protein SCDLUD_000064 [Saccharomycodes ludwigii]
MGLCSSKSSTINSTTSDKQHQNNQHTKVKNTNVANINPKEKDIPHSKNKVPDNTNTEKQLQSNHPIPKKKDQNDTASVAKNIDNDKNNSSSLNTTENIIVTNSNNNNASKNKKLAQNATAIRKQSTNSSSGSSTNKLTVHPLKMLLLGSGESGKSTILQQLKILHQNGYTDKELMAYRPFIMDNIIEIGKDLIHARDLFGLNDYTDDDYKIYINGRGKTDITYDELRNSIIDFQLFNLSSVIKNEEDGEEVRANTTTTEIIESEKFILFIKNLDILWCLPSTRKLLNDPMKKSQFYLMDNSGYFVKKLVLTSEILNVNYKPSLTDILNCRKKTTGIHDTIVNMDDNLVLHIYDVGGQRNERKKWIHSFDKVSIILFCVSLSEYDQTLAEDSSTNRLEESLVLFDSLVNSRWFTNCSVILFLNKIDLFADKITKVPLSNYFPDYTGGPDINKAAKYILWRFLQLNKVNLNIYPHITQATDTSNIQLVFAAVKETVLENSLKDSGVL